MRGVKCRGIAKTRNSKTFSRAPKSREVKRDWESDRRCVGVGSLAVQGQHFRELRSSIPGERQEEETALTAYIEFVRSPCGMTIRML